MAEQDSGALMPETPATAPLEKVYTPRLLLRRPSLADAEAIFSRYAADPEVTKYVGWPRHRSVEETQAFLAFSESEWARWPVGPYLIESRADQRLLGSTGFGFETPATAMTGYVLARDSWGQGYATEALQLIVSIARQLRLERLYALCHPANTASIRVLQKGGFLLEGLQPRRLNFPNLPATDQGDCLQYVSEKPEDPMLFCPSCSQRLQQNHCKLVCEKCGYFMSCADYY